MGKVFRIVSVCATLLLAAAAAAVYLRPLTAQADGQIVGFVNSDEVLDNYSVAKTVNSELAALRKKSEANLEKEVKGKFGSGDVSTLPRESQLEIKKMIEQAEDKFQKESDALRKKKWEPIVKKVNETIGKVAKEEKLQVVLEQESVLYGGVNITNKVIAKLKE